MIQCEVTGFDVQKRRLKTYWLVETGAEIDNSIENNLDEDTVRKLTRLKNETET